MAGEPPEQRIAVLEEALEASRARVDELYDLLPDPLLTVDADTTVLACNRTGLEWLGLTRDQVVGRPLVELFAEEHRGDLAQVASAGWAWAAERRFGLPDGRVVGLNALGHGEGDARRFHVTIHDLTTRRVLDRAAGQRRRMEALSQLAGAIARELNDPMSIVQGRLELLLELGVEDPEAVRRHLGVALEHARRVSATLRNLRLVGRTHAPRAEPVQLAGVFEQTLELVGPRAREVSVELQPPELATSGEAAMYARVFANLVRRALELSARNGSVDLRGRLDPGSVVVVQVSAGGARGRVRDPAEVVGSQGVSIDETLLASVGGRLQVDTGPLEVGFTVRLPSPPHRRARARRVEDHLLVVGSEAFCGSVSALVAREGFAVRAARSGEAALSALTETDPPVDAVVTELLLGGMSGLGLAEAVLRTRPDLKGRVVLVSQAGIDNPPPAVVALREPLRGRALLEALGRRVR